MKKLLYISILLALPNVITAQTIKAYHSSNGTAYPKLTWFYQGKSLETMKVIVFRGDQSAENFEQIQTLLSRHQASDTIFYTVVDSTLKEKGLYSYYIQLQDGDSTHLKSELLYGHNMGYIAPPQILSLTTQADANQKAIQLNWKINYDFTVQSLTLFRSRKHKDGYELIAHLPKDARSYNDRVDIANEAYFYFIQIRDFFGYQKPSVRVHGIATYSEKALPPQNLHIGIESGKVHLDWRKVGNNITSYRVYRASTGIDKFFPIASIKANLTDETTFIDSSVNMVNRQTVKYYVTTISDGFEESTPSDTVSALVMGKLIVSPPAKLTVSNDSLNHRLLIWETQDKNTEVQGYNVYCINKSDETIQLNELLLPAHINYFTDSTSGNTADSYEIETVSITGTPSAYRTRKRAEAIENKAHLIVSAEATDIGIKLTWKPLKSVDMKQLKIYRSNGTDEPQIIATLGAELQTYTDNKIKDKQTYFYYFIAHLNNGEELMVNNGISMSFSGK